MMKKFLYFFVIILCFLLVSSSFGLPPEKPKEKKEKVKEFDFEGDVVEAEFLRPEEATIEAIARRKKASLIQIRNDFVDEILKSSEDL